MNRLDLAGLSYFYGKLKGIFVQTVNGEKPVDGNVTVNAEDDGDWKANETVKVGDIRTIKGRDNTGYILECISAGTTGDTQPSIDEYSSTEESDALVTSIVAKIYPTLKAQVLEESYPAWKAQVYSDLKAQLLNDTYPVGSIYTSESSTSPAVLFGGTWEAMPAGRVLVSQGTYTENSETFTFTAGTSGGEAKHQLTVGELPKVDGSWPTIVAGYHANWTTGNAYGCGGGNWYRKDTKAWGTPPLTGGTTTISPVYGYGFRFGNDERHSVLQPYYSVYRWRRTA